MRVKLEVTFLFVIFLFAGMAQAAWLDPVLENRLDTANSDEHISAYIVMKQQVDLQGAIRDSVIKGGTLADRHFTIINRLQEMASDSQAPILSMLETSKRDGKVFRHRSFWISNSIAVEATPAFINKLRNQDDILSIFYDAPIELIGPVRGFVPEADIHSKGVENGILVTRAQELWAMGIDGTGTLACDQDTGADGTHPAFANRWRGLEDGVSPSEAWFDPINNEEFPTDSGTHGTHTLGTILGGDDGDNQIGMAPRAQWIGAKTIDITGGNIFSDAVAAFQWAADPDGDPTTTEDVPDVINNSWGLALGYYGSCRSEFNAAIDAAEAAGVVVIFAAGNEGALGSGFLRSPANRAQSDLNVFSIGALEQDGETIAYFSSRGPSDCDGVSLKPEVSAVGENVRSSMPDNQYGYASGTSMAAPHVSGAVLLLRQAFPEATPEEIKTALYMSAVDLGDTGEDNTFGRGRIDLVEAYLYLLEYMVNSDGKVRIEDAYNCESTVTVSLFDEDLEAYAQVLIWSDTETEPESVVLFESETSGKFSGTISTQTGTPVADGILQVKHNDTITVEYLDENNGEGGFNILKTDEGSIDCQPPDFQGLVSVLEGDASVTLSWDEAVDPLPVAYNVYRAIESGGQNFNSPVETVTNSPYVDQVANGVKYYYVVRAMDSVGNEETNTVELYSTPMGPSLVWWETWENEDKWEHAWTIEDGGSGDGTWTDTNPGERTIGAMNGNFMIADSYYYKMSEMDESLISEEIDVTGMHNILLRFTQDFHYFQNEYGDVDAKFDGGPWVNLVQNTRVDIQGLTEVDMSAYSFDTVQLRFHYYDASFEWWWAIDDIGIWGWGQVLCYKDKDLDNFGSPEVSQRYEAPECPIGWSENSKDCNDLNGDIHPAAEDAECDGIDDNCDGIPDDQYVPYSCGIGECGNNSVCQNATQSCTPNEPTAENCTDDKDNDCDQMIDFDDTDCHQFCATPFFEEAADDMSVQFTDKSEPSFGDIVSWEWDFGDGTNSSEQNPLHTYAAEGEYLVCLSVTDTLNCTLQLCKSVSVAEGGVGCGITPEAQNGNLFAALPLLIVLLAFVLMRRRVF